MRKHTILDHPILGYFLLLLFAQILSSLFSQIIDIPLGRIIPGYVKEYEILGQTQESAMGIGNAVGSLAAVGIFWLWFRPEFKGCLKKQALGTGLLMMAPVLVIHYMGSVVSWFSYGTSSVLLAFLMAFAPGFGEEIMFRGLGIANYMRTIKSDEKIWTIFWLSSIVFGLAHMANIASGAGIINSVVQSVYAIGIGMLFAAVYLRTGNLWPTIIGHFTVDFMEFVRADIGESGGVMLNLGVGDWITVAAAVFAFFWALRLMKREYFPEIMELWRDKWSGVKPSAE